MAWHIRPETADDIEAVRAVVLAAFDTPAEADLVDALRADPAWLVSMVAVDDGGRVAGHALLTRCHIGDVPAVALAPVSVAPAHQRTGAGTDVTRAALDEAAARGEHVAVVLGHPEYYPRFGFERADGVRLSIDVPAEALMTLSLDGRPVPTGLVSYAAPFGI